MSNRYTPILAAGGAAVLAAALGVPTAAAAATAKTWTVQPGGTITAMSSGQFTLKDTKTGTVFHCVSSAGSGTLRSGSGLPGSNAGSLSAVGFGHCTSPGGPKFTMQAGGLPWHVNLSAYNAAEDVARGTISHIHLMLTGPDGTCSGTIDGTSGTARRESDVQVYRRHRPARGADHRR